MHSNPASTTNWQRCPEERLITGFTRGRVRLARGLEGVEGLLAVLDAGFRAAGEAGPRDGAGRDPFRRPRPAEGGRVGATRLPAARRGAGNRAPGAAPRGHPPVRDLGGAP